MRGKKRQHERDGEVRGEREQEDLHGALADAGEEESQGAGGIDL
jgi:hypothetical protein